ncbi:MAG TPA: hypothetical protein VHH94_06195 [Gammaproteobacteria bacterium]|nr:hypothetical protein [Gammaproteobacteria bacterium]
MDSHMKEKLAERLEKLKAELEVKLARLRTPFLRISGASARGDTRSRSRGAGDPAG